MDDRPQLEIIGAPEVSLFGLRSDAFLERMAKGIEEAAGLVLRARADIVVTEPVLRWLAQRPGTTITDAAGCPLIGFAGADAAVTATVPSGTETVFVRKLRRREQIEVLDLLTTSTAAIERKLFRLVYKGVTDVVTGYVWPEPAFHVVRLLSRLHVTPNAVTVVGMVLVVVASWRFAKADWAGGLAAAWLMTFLDTVDGKLARVTATSSWLGNILDHGTDVVHPPAWWACVAYGIARSTGDASVWTSLVVILLAYLFGRIGEAAFKLRFGFNQYLWKRFDGRLRTIIARRNIILLFLTASALFGTMAAGWAAAAIWSAISIGVQVVRTLQALRQERLASPVKSWMTEPAA